MTSEEIRGFTVPIDGVRYQDVMVVLLAGIFRMARESAAHVAEINEATKKEAR